MKALSEYEDGDIIEPEDWRNPEESGFNHQVLVMTAMKKCLDLGSKELREGWFNEKVDKNGNVARTYMEDTRKAFIESVKSLMMIVACDYDDEAKDKIPSLSKKIDERKKHWMDEEWNWWKELSPQQQRQLSQEGKQVIKGFFNRKLNFDNLFFEEETQLYREICTEINKLTFRLDFYGDVGYSG